MGWLTTRAPRLDTKSFRLRRSGTRSLCRRLLSCHLSKSSASRSRCRTCESKTEDTAAYLGLCAIYYRPTVILQQNQNVKLFSFSFVTGRLEFHARHASHIAGPSWIRRVDKRIATFHPAVNETRSIGRRSGGRVFTSSTLYKLQCVIVCM